MHWYNWCCHLDFNSMQCKVLFEVSKFAINWCRYPPDYIYRPSKKIDTLWPSIQSYNVQHRDNVLGMDQFERRRRRGPFAAWMLSHRKIREAGEGCREESKYHNLSVILSNACYALRYLILKQFWEAWELSNPFQLLALCDYLEHLYIFNSRHILTCVAVIQVYLVLW